MKTKLFFLLLVVLLNTQINAQCWQSVSAGGLHTIAIKTDGTLWAWGINVNGQLGDNTIVFDINTPIQIGTATNWQSVSAGLNYTVAIKTDGTLWAWGYNNYGELGDGTIISKNTPTQIGIATNWKTIVAGEYHTVGIKTNGTLWAWGNNKTGALGDGTMIDKTTPTQIGVATNWQSISIGNGFTVGIKTNGTLWSWGYNTNGQLGDGTIINKNTPTQIGVATNWKSIDAGQRHVVAVKTDGTLWAWGINFEGQLGDGTTVERHSPIKIGIATNWQSVSAGDLHSVAIKTDGVLWAWGYNGSGQLGQDLLTHNYYFPQTLLNPVANNLFITAGAQHNGVIKVDGTLWAWGYNQDGQIGDGTTVTNVIVPTQIGCTALGTEKISLSNDSFSIYPNPVNDILHIQSSTNQVIDKIVITDLIGKKVLEQKGNNKQLNVQQLQQGMYLLHVFSEGKSSLSKFLKQ